jgi:hypothetical protein
VKRHAVTQPVDKPYRFIPLTQGQNAIVDVMDFDRLMQWHWQAQWTPSTKGFYARGGGRKKVLMHRFILGCESSEQVDHKNHDTLDNRRENLRTCSNTQNTQNSRVQKGMSGFKGVKLLPSGNWFARITSNGKQISLGTFATREQAAHTYNEAAKLYHGEFAHINQV